MTGHIQWSANKWLDDDDYRKQMKIFGQTGGLSRGKKYHPVIAKVVNLYLNYPQLNQQEIANECNISQAFVSIHTRGLKPLRKGKRVPTEEVLRVIEILRTKDAVENVILDNIILNNQEELDDFFKL